MHQSSATKRAPFTPVEALVLVSGNGEARAALEAQCGPGAVAAAEKAPRGAFNKLG
jgi:hypothetical protein